MPKPMRPMTERERELARRQASEPVMRKRAQAAWTPEENFYFPWSQVDEVPPMTSEESRAAAQKVKEFMERDRCEAAEDEAIIEEALRHVDLKRLVADERPCSALLALLDRGQDEAGDR